MWQESLRLEEGERILGNWTVNYLAPSGYRIPGRLAVTDRRVLFAGGVEARSIQEQIVGPVDSTAVAYAFDLDVDHVRYDGDRLCLSIPKSDIECVTPDCLLVSNRVCLTLKNNGSIQLFERRVLSVTPLMHAIQEKSRVAE